MKFIFVQRISTLVVYDLSKDTETDRQKDKTNGQRPTDRQTHVVNHQHATIKIPEQYEVSRPMLAAVRTLRQPRIPSRILESTIQTWTI